jgi:hypothetical protein
MVVGNNCRNSPVQYTVSVTHLAWTRQQPPMKH